MYASKSTIDLRRGVNGFPDWRAVKSKLDYIDPRGYINIVWLAIQATVFLYNAWVIPLRLASCPH